MTKAHFREQRRGKRSPAERMSFALSTLVLLALVALVIFQRVSDGDNPASISATALLNTVRQVKNDYYVTVEITNSGTKTAEAVRIAGRVGNEVREFEIDFLDGDETSQGILIFRTDPRATPLAIEVLSFREP